MEMHKKSLVRKTKGKAFYRSPDNIELDLKGNLANWNLVAVDMFQWLIL